MMLSGSIGSGHVVAPRSRVHRLNVRASAAATTAVKVVVKDYGAATLKGSVRKINEDRYDVQLPSAAAPGDPVAFVGVYDGHGGTAVAEWLKDKLFGVIEQHWDQGKRPEESIATAYVQADKRLLTPRSGFMGMGERGVGGSKCGATSATALLYQAPDGTTKLLTANIGDARIVLIRDGKAEQLTVDHVPDVESERKRIEKTNPNPKNPLVRYVAGTWRVGGLLALSRAFGDAYLKGSLQFEGITAGGDGYSSGFGVVAEPHVTLNSLTESDSWLIIASDGLYAEEERGGGGGLDNEKVASMCEAAAANKTSCSKLAESMAAAAVQVGSTDDVTLVVVRLGTA